MKRSHLGACAVIAALAAAATVSADELLLDDGTVLVGRVTELAGGTVSIETDYAGTLAIDAARVRGIRCDAPVTVQLESGERIVGTLRYEPETGLVVESAAVGPQSVTVKEIESMWAEGRQDPAVAAARAEAEAQKPKWSLRLEFGLSGQSGNSEQVAANGRGELRRTTPSDRFLLYTQGRFSRENGVVSAREIIGGAELEVDITSKLFAYGRLELENDEFEDLDLRLNLAGGLGYVIIREEDMELKVRGGPGYQFESFTDGTTRDGAVLEGNLAFRYDLSPWVRYTLGLTGVVVLDDVDNFRVVVENAAEVPISKDEDWKLRLGVRNQYANQPRPGVERLDTYYFANVVYEF